MKKAKIFKDDDNGSAEDKLNQLFATTDVKAVLGFSITDRKAAIIYVE